MIISRKLPSRLEAVSKPLSEIIDKIKYLPIKDEDIFNIKLSIEEALVNAIKHGNKLKPDLYVELTVESRDNHLVITIKDEGEGFDFKNLPDPTTPDNLSKPTGRGIFLIRKLMDKVDFFDCGRGIKMIKFFRWRHNLRKR